PRTPPFPPACGVAPGWHEGDPCPRDRCDGDPCRHDAMAGVESVRCAFAVSGLRPAVCEGQRLPAAVAHPLDGADRLVEGADGSRRGRRRMRKALARLEKAQARLARLRHPTDCTRSLAASVADAIPPAHTFARSSASST